MCATHFTSVFALFLWSGTELAIPLRSACTLNESESEVTQSCPTVRDAMNCM